MAKCEGCPLVVACQDKRKQSEAEKARLDGQYLQSTVDAADARRMVDELPLRTPRVGAPPSLESLGKLNALAEADYRGRIGDVQRQIEVFSALVVSVQQSCPGGPREGSCVSPERETVKKKLDQ